MAGVAPDVDAGERACRSGLRLRLPRPARRRARRTRATTGIAVVNMSFYIDPWLDNCARQPGRLARGAAASSGRIIDGHAAGPRLRPHARRHAGRRRSATSTATSAQPRSPTPSARTSRYGHRRKTRTVTTRSCLDHADRGPMASSPSQSVGPSEPRRPTTRTTASEQTDVVAPGGYFGDPGRSPFPQGGDRLPWRSTVPLPSTPQLALIHPSVGQVRRTAPGQSDRLRAAPTASRAQRVRSRSGSAYRSTRMRGTGRQRSDVRYELRAGAAPIHTGERAA